MNYQIELEYEGLKLNLDFNMDYEAPVTNSLPENCSEGYCEVNDMEITLEGNDITDILSEKVTNEIEDLAKEIALRDGSKKFD